MMSAGLNEKDRVNFMLRAPKSMFGEHTIFQAGLVVNFLKQVGREVLGGRGGSGEGGGGR